MSGIINSVGSKSGIISDGLDIYAQLNNCSQTYGDMTFGTLTGDSTNLTQSGANVTLVKSGVYFITCCFNWYMTSGEERYCFGHITSVSGSYGSVALSTCNDQVAREESDNSYGGATATFVGTFAASDVIKFNYSSGSGGDVTNRADSHASIFRIFN